MVLSRILLRFLELHPTTGGGLFLVFDYFFCQLFVSSFWLCFSCFVFGWCLFCPFFFVALGELGKKGVRKEGVISVCFFDHLTFWFLFLRYIFTPKSNKSFSAFRGFIWLHKAVAWIISKDSLLSTQKWFCGWHIEIWHAIFKWKRPHEDSFRTSCSQHPSDHWLPSTGKLFFPELVLKGGYESTMLPEKRLQRRYIPSESIVESNEYRSKHCKMLWTHANCILSSKIAPSVTLICWSKQVDKSSIVDFDRRCFEFLDFIEWRKKTISTPKTSRYVESSLRRR